MSQIDGSMEPNLRKVLLSEVRELLPAFLSAASIERDGPVNAAGELLGLPESDRRRVLAVHLLLSQPVREFVSALPTGVRQPRTSSIRPRVTGRCVTSSIDWAATIRHRATSSPLGDVWVTRPANRIFDIPENRALAWVLKTIEERATIAAPPHGNAPGIWGDEIRSMSVAVQWAKRAAWLKEIPSIWPGDAAYLRLKADRTGFYSSRVANASRYLRHLLVTPSPEDVVEALCQRYFEPTQDWKLFEIAVLLRIVRALAAIGTRMDPTRLFHEPGSRPFAKYRISSERVVQVWYQTWPPATRPSKLEDAIRHYGIQAIGNRPDIVIELIDKGVSTRAVLLELKASSSSSYLGSGLSQLLGYLNDRPRLLSGPASGWLVAPAGAHLVPNEHGGRELWITDADSVAASVSALVANRPAA